MSQQQLETLFEFPCEFPIKVMGDKKENLQAVVLKALESIGVDLKKVKMDARESSGGTYLSVTAKFEASSKKQLDEIYKLLTSNPAVKIVL